MSEVAGKTLWNQWRSAIDMQIKKENWYRLGGRDPLTGLDCSGFAEFVLTELGLNVIVNGYNTVGLYNLPIWSDRPDYKGLGNRAPLFSMTWTTNSDGSLPSVGHVSLRYNYAYQVHITGEYNANGHQQPLVEIIQNFSRLMNKYDSGGVVDGGAITTEYDDLLSQIDTARDAGVFSSSVDDFVDKAVELTDEDGNPTGRFTWNWRRFGFEWHPQSEEGQWLQNLGHSLIEWKGLISMVRRMPDTTTWFTDGDGHWDLDSDSVGNYVKFLADAINGMTPSAATRWLVNQAIGRDIEDIGERNGIFMFPRYALTEKHGIYHSTKYLNWSNAGSIFGTI